MGEECFGAVGADEVGYAAADLREGSAEGVYEEQGEGIGGRPIPYKVYVVVDREFGEHLAEMEQDIPVWIVNTPTNKTVVQRLWKERPDEGHLTGITAFNNVDSFSPEDLLVAQLGPIDLHHGSCSADPPYTIIEVLGTPITERVRNELAAYGFNEFHTNSAGFTAERPKPLD